MHLGTWPGFAGRPALAQMALFTCHGNNISMLFGSQSHRQRLGGVAAAAVGKGQPESLGYAAARSCMGLLRKRRTVLVGTNHTCRITLERTRRVGAIG